MRGNAGRAVSVTPVLMPGMEVNASCPRGRAGEGRPRRAGRERGACNLASGQIPPPRPGRKNLRHPATLRGGCDGDFAKSRISAYIRRVVTHCRWIRSGGQHPCSPGDSHKQISHERVFPVRWPGPSVHREALAACPSCRIVRLAMPEIAIPERGFVPAAGKQLIGAVDQALFSARRVGIACCCEAERQRRGGEGAAAAEKSAGKRGP